MSIELMTYFEGDWNFTREIKTDQEKLFAVAKGNATFTKDSNAHNLLYNEDGELHLKRNETKNLFYKSYLFSFFKDHIKVYFSGGANSEQLYQEYKYAENKISPLAEHACNRDFYNTEYQITDQDQFKQVTKISGPQKDFRITTLFSRIKID